MLGELFFTLLEKPLEEFWQLMETQFNNLVKEPQ